jgi:hypothetical protein
MHSIPLGRTYAVCTPGSWLQKIICMKAVALLCYVKGVWTLEPNTCVHQACTWCVTLKRPLRRSKRYDDALRDE